MNIENMNIALFKSYSDAIRFKEGNQAYQTSPNGIQYYEAEMDRNEFFRLYKKYSIAQLAKICGLTQHYIQLKIKEYNLPRKSEITLDDS